MILRSYEVMTLLSQLEARKESWDNLAPAKRPTEARKYSEIFKKNYDVLYKKLNENCKCSPEETFWILIPVLECLLDVMKSIDEGTEFRSVFTADDLSFFAGCRKLYPENQDKEHVHIEQLNKMLVDNYPEWCMRSFPCSLNRKNNEEDCVPAELFLQISNSFLTDRKEVPDETAAQMRDYFQKHYRLNVSDQNAKTFIAALIQRNPGGHSLDEKYIREWENWLSDCGLENDKRSRLEYIYPLYADAFRENSTISPEYAAFLHNELNGFPEDERTEAVQNLMGEAKKYLTVRFHEWSREGFRCQPKNQPAQKELFLPVAIQWLESAAAQKQPEPETVQEQKNVIRSIQDYCRETREINVKDDGIATLVFRWMGERIPVTVSDYKEQQEWLTNCRIRENSVSCMLMLPLAARMTEDEEAMRQTGVLFIGEHMESVERYQKEWPEKEQEEAGKITRKESAFLLENFTEWRQAQNEEGNTQRKKSDLLAQLGKRWQEELLADTELSSDELSRVLSSISNIQDSEGKKLDLSQLKKHIVYVQLKETEENCRKEPTPDSLKSLAECYQKAYAFGDDIDQYETIVQDASDTLSRNFIAWSQIDFQAGEKVPDASIIPVAEKWLQTLSGAHSSAVSSGGLKDITERMAALSVMRSAEGKELLNEARERCFDLMRSEMRDQKTETDPLWWDRLSEFYHDETDKAGEYRQDAVRWLDNACRKKNQKAKQIITGILEENRNVVPEEAAGLSGWNEVQTERIQEAFRNMLSRYGSPDDLSESRLAETWQKEYSQDYAVGWEELSRTGFFKESAAACLEDLYDSSSAEDRSKILRQIWDTGAEDPSKAGGLSGIEQSFVKEKLTSQFSEFWKDADHEGRTELEKFAGKVSLDLKNTDVGRAKDFLKDYENETPMSTAAIGHRIAELARRPEWRKSAR